MVDGRDAPPIEQGHPDSTAGGVHLPRVRALDGLRGLAVLAVLVFHDGHLTGGYLGVDLFFVLSGFLITSLLLVEHRRSHRVRLGRFYERRARRLLPALVLALAFVAVYAAVWAQPSELARIRSDGLATLFYVANWHDIAAKQSYWDVFTAPSALQHTWSLAIEEQFYLVWPLIVIGTLAIGRRARSVLWVALLLGTACATFTVFSGFHHGDEQFLYYGLQSRAPAMLMGAALAAATVEWGPLRSRASRLALEGFALIGAGYLAYEWTRQPGQGLGLYRGPLLLCGLAATVIIAAASHPKRGPVAWVLAFPPLIGLGLISYGLYLYHWPIYLILTRSRTGLSEWPLFGLRVAVSIAAAIASYFIVEMPIRRGAFRPTRAFVALGAATAMIVVALFATTVVPARPGIAATGGTAARHWPRPTEPVVPGATVRSFLPPGDWSRLTNTCEVNRGLPAVVSVGRTRQPKVLMLGDSVGCFLGAAFDEQQVGDGVVTLNRSRLGCPMVEAARERQPGGAEAPTYPACIEGENAAVAAFDPDVSVLLVGGPMVNEYDLGNGKFVSPCSAAFAPWYEAGARRSVAALAARGAPVAVVSVVHPPKFIDVGAGVNVPASYGRDVDCLNRLLRRVVATEPYAHWIDLDGYICPHGACRDEIDGVKLRGDGRHFQGLAATLVAKWLLPRVAALSAVHAVPDQQ